MRNFTFYTPTLYSFGDGQEKEVANLVRQFGGTKVLIVHYGGDFLKWTTVYQDVTNALKEAGMPYAELDGVEPNPKSDKVYEGIELCRKENCDFILALGGGSTIDCAKAIGLGAIYDGDFWDLFEEKAPITKTLPVGVVLTIAASGSEGSGHCVITHLKDNLKWGVPPTDIIRPKFAIENPRYTTSLPPYQTACGIVDMISHVLERYLSISKGVRLTDRISEALMKTAIESGRKAMKDPGDYDARCDLMWVATLAQNDSSGVGRIPDWGAHLIEHELSALFEVAHGAGLAIITPAYMKYVMPAHVDRFAQFAVQVFGCDMNWEYPERTAEEGIKLFEDFCVELGLPTRLSALNVTEADIPAIVKHREAKGFPFGFFRPLQPEDMAAVLKLAL